MAHNAKAGGEIGANGEFYKGGQFVADNPNTNKGSGNQKKKPRKIEIEPYKWILAEPNVFPIIPKAGVGRVSKFKRVGGWNDFSELELCENAEELCRLNGWNMEEFITFIGKYNKGERTFEKN